MKYYKIKLQFILSIGVILLLFTATTAFVGQRSFKVQNEGSTMVVTGTSSLHDWKLVVNDFNCDMTATADQDHLQIDAVTFKGKSNSISSDNSLMDKKTHQALKTDKFPEVKFTISSSKGLSLKDQTFSGHLVGDLFLAGRTKTETIEVTGKLLSDNKVQVVGSKQLKMTDFGISPPSAMMGAIKAGDEVTVSFTLVLSI